MSQAYYTFNFTYYAKVKIAQLSLCMHIDLKIDAGGKLKEYAKQDLTLEYGFPFVY